MNIYPLTRQFWDWSFENPEKITPVHSAIYFFAIETCNRMGWSKKFSFPSYNCMQAINVKSRTTFYKCFNELVEYGFIQIVEKSKNQNTANIISLVQNLNRHKNSTRTALDLALIQHADSTGTINIQDTNIQDTKKQYKTIDSFSLEDTRQEMELFISVWNKRLGEDRRITDKFEEKYKLMRKKYSIEDLRKSFVKYYEAKKGSTEYRLSPLSFITQSNGIPNYL